MLLSEDRACTNLSAGIPTELDSIAFDDIHLRTCQETYPVARTTRKTNVTSISLKEIFSLLLLDSIVVNHWLHVQVLVLSELNDDRTSRKLYLVHCKLISSIN